MSTPSATSPQQEAARYCTFCKTSFRMEIPRCPRDGYPVEIRDQDPLLGEILGNCYRIDSVLGYGGMGRVYNAERLDGGGTVAVKVLHGDVSADDKMIARFEREARAISRLSSPHIVAIVDFGNTPEGLLYLVMERLMGKPLHEAIAQEGPFSIERSIYICRQIALALAHAHDRGLIHRDLKPANVMLSHKLGIRDCATILDFGLARMTQTEDPKDSEMLTSMGVIRGTPEFMSPEQARGLELDPRSDLYALGVLFYLMLTQRFPYPRPKSRLDVLTMHVMTPAFRVEKFKKVPEEVERIVAKMLAKELDERYQTGDEIVRDLEAVERMQGFSPIPLPIGADFNTSNPFALAGSSSDEVIHENEPTRVYTMPPSMSAGLELTDVYADDETSHSPEQPSTARRSTVFWAILTIVAITIGAITVILWKRKVDDEAYLANVVSTQSQANSAPLEPPQSVAVPTSTPLPPVSAPVSQPIVSPTPNQPTSVSITPAVIVKPTVTPTPNKVSTPTPTPAVKTPATDPLEVEYKKAKTELDAAMGERGLSRSDLKSTGQLGVMVESSFTLGKDKKYKEAIEFAKEATDQIRAIKPDRKILQAKLTAVKAQIDQKKEKGASSKDLESVQKSYFELTSRFSEKVSQYPAGSAEHESLNREINKLRARVAEL